MPPLKPKNNEQLNRPRFQAPRKCDTCNHDLLDGHISLFLGHHSGYKEELHPGHWEHTIRHYGIFSFCNGVCVAKYFDIESMKDRGNVNRGNEPFRPIVHFGARLPIPPTQRIVKRIIR